MSLICTILDAFDLCNEARIRFNFCTNYEERARFADLISTCNICRYLVQKGYKVFGKKFLFLVETGCFYRRPSIDAFVPNFGNHDMILNALIIKAYSAYEALQYAIRDAEEVKRSEGFEELPGSNAWHLLQEYDDFTSYVKCMTILQKSDQFYYAKKDVFDYMSPTDIIDPIYAPIFKYNLSDVIFREHFIIMSSKYYIRDKYNLCDMYSEKRVRTVHFERLVASENLAELALKNAEDIIAVKNAWSTFNDPDSFKLCLNVYNKSIRLHNAKEDVKYFMSPTDKFVDAFINRDDSFTFYTVNFFTAIMHCNA